MTDKREAILVRLLSICAEVEGVLNAYRNKPGIPAEARPAVLILDADEQAKDDDPPARIPRAYRRVDMTPEIYILLGADPTEVGSDCNTLRARLIKAILTDTDLAALTLDGKGVRYEACTLALGAGKQIEASMGVSFSFTYLLNPADL